MTLLTPHLTAAPFDEAARATRRGMASWVVPGSAHCCGECRFWGSATPPRHGFGTPAPQRCEMFLSLTGKRGPTVPHGTKACRFFEKAGNP
jgi:hypothetical protein